MARFAERAGDADQHRFRIRLFDADRTDDRLTFQEALGHRPTGNQLLWIDLTGTPTEDEAAMLGDAFEINGDVRRAIRSADASPGLALQGGAFHLRLAAEPDDKRPEDVQWLDIIAGANVVVTRHDDPLRFLAEMDQRIEHDSAMGKLDAPLFVASLLDSAVTTYFRAVDAIEDDADELDALALRDEGRRELLADLVAVRRRVARMRRLLAGHRDLFASLASVDIAAVEGGDDAGPAFQAVAGRFDAAVTAVDDAREAILGSFDIHMTRTAQRTNDVMKVLTLATVLLLPGSVIAGLLGMNVTVPLNKDDPLSFWLVVVGVGILAAAVITFAHRRHWL